MYVWGMDALKQTRNHRGLSQRSLARCAGVSFRALQMIEAGQTDPRLSSLVKIASALGTPDQAVPTELARLISEHPDSAINISRKISLESEASWKLWLFEFVDTFRRCPSEALVASPPIRETSDRIRAMLTSTVEVLCQEASMQAPWWCGGIDALISPWFVTGVENLKATALVESPPHFRKRNIFVLGNFLMRV
ncbi:MAG: helix-turn-helix transcriptional regulator [Lentisphaeria bacterium]|nr:helix-turn-helix transcriptional regulator [Lentisphaeria bacterium]